MIIFQASPQKDLFHPFKWLAASGVNLVAPGATEFVWKDGGGFDFVDSPEGTFKDD